VPASLIIGFVEAHDFEGLTRGIDGIWRAVTDGGEALRQT
jgi:hypothetical protein